MKGYDGRDATFDAFGRHVSGGKVALYRELGVDVVMGSRSGVTFHDAFSERVFVNCHVNGGVFLGLNGIVMKSHGGTDAEGFAASMDIGLDVVRYSLLEHIARDLEKFRNTRPVAAAVTQE